MRRTDPTPETVKLVRERDDWRCARCAGWGPLSTQHRVSRGMGGSSLAWINAPANLLTLCGTGTTQCHGWVEHHPHWSRLHGWAMARGNRLEPSSVPVWTWRGWVALRDDGRLLQLPKHPGVPGCDCGCRPLPPPPAGLWLAPSMMETETP